MKRVVPDGHPTPANCDKSQCIVRTKQTTKSPGMAKLLAALFVLASSAVQAQPAFDLNKPAAVFELAGELEEISALSMGPDNLLLAVQDEDGYIYRLDPESGDVVRRDRFAGSGDYEGIEWVGEWIFVMESNGHLYRTPALQPTRGETLRIRLDLPGGCDAEGLAWNGPNERFLVSCKDADGVRGQKGRSVFAFSRIGELIGRELFMDDDLLESAGVDGVSDFRTSAVAVHPITGRIFLLSSDDPALCEINDGQLMCQPLDLKTMRQPEGLTFDTHGALWISSEARGKTPTLHRFDPASE